MALIVGNLDCEVALARDADPERAERLPELPRPVLELVSAAATLLRALARHGDRLWVPAPVDAGRLAEHPRLPRVDLTRGPLGARADEPVLAWGETEAVAAVRGATTERRPPPWGAHPGPVVSRRCNDHDFAWQLARARGWQLPAAARVESPGELVSAVRAASEHGARGAWVARAPLSASGRRRLRRRGPALDTEARAHAERLLGHYGRLYVEPWVDRIADVGCCGFIDASGEVERHPLHRLDNDPAGVFRGVSLRDPTADDWLHPDEADLVRTAAAAAGATLARAGHRGPFGVDGYVWRDVHGRRRVQPMSEINARLSFAWVARAFADALQMPGARLVLGRQAAPAGGVPLLRPAPPDRVGAWLVDGGGCSATS